MWSTDSLQHIMYMYAKALLTDLYSLFFLFVLNASSERLDGVGVGGSGGNQDPRVVVLGARGG